MLFSDTVAYVRASAAPGFTEYLEGMLENADKARKHIAQYGVREVIKTDNGVESTGGFLDYEETTAAVMLAAWSRKAEEAYNAIMKELNGSYNADALAKGVERANKLLSDVVTDADAQVLRANLAQAARRGASIANALTAFDALPNNQAIFDGMVTSSRYWTNNYFNNQVMPSLYKAAQDVIDANGLTLQNDVFRAIREQLDKRLLKKTPYWHTVSSAAASRAYHYGMIKGGRRVGYVGYRLDVVQDHRTSDICTSLVGREYWLADAELLYDRAANAQDEDIKDVHPWITKEERTAMTEQQIYDRAVYVPPFHGRCRTSMLLLSA